MSAICLHSARSRRSPIPGRKEMLQRHEARLRSSTRPRETSTPAENRGTYRSERLLATSAGFGATDLSNNLNSLPSMSSTDKLVYTQMIVFSPIMNRDPRGRLFAESVI